MLYGAAERRNGGRGSTRVEASMQKTDLRQSRACTRTGHM